MVDKVIRIGLEWFGQAAIDELYANNLAGKNILAGNPGYNGTADCDFAENDNQDVWVFVWPGKTKVGTIKTVSIGWDSDGNGSAEKGWPGAAAPAKGCAAPGWLASASGGCR